MKIFQRLKIKLLTFVFVFGLLSSPVSAIAHQPFIEPAEPLPLEQMGFYFEAVKVVDPTYASQAVYGNLATPEEYDLYYFESSKDETIPVNALVSVLGDNPYFAPSVYVMSKDLIESNTDTAPLEIPEGYKTYEIKFGEPNYFWEPFSAEQYRGGEEYQLPVKAGKRYFIAVADPNQQTGKYTLGLGTVENFEQTDFKHLLGNVLKIKLGLTGNVVVPWLELLGLFLMIAGFVIGLGAVTVIDWLGFLGRKSPYWTEATIRSHKVTKPLIWVGIGLLVAGGMITYRESFLSGVALYQAIITIVLILNGLFLTFWMSPRLLRREQEGKASEVLPNNWQKAITVSFLFSFVGWWLNLSLFVWYLVMQR